MRRRRYGVRRLARVAGALLLVGSATAALVAETAESAGPAFAVFVNGRRVVVDPELPTTRQALEASGTGLAYGRLVAAVSGKVLDPEHTPPRLVVDGVDAVTSTPLLRGSRVIVRAGADVVEETEVRQVPVPSTGLPGEEQALWRPGTAGLDEVVVGKLSGEEVARKNLQPATPAVALMDKVVALSFDDGPSADFTPEILRVLREHEVKAMFCIVGSQARRHPDLVRGIAGEGHTLCNHTQNHPMRLDIAPRATVAAEVLAGDMAIRDIVGSPAPFYRPPGGSLSPAVIEEAHRRGQRVSTWTIDSLDYRPQTPEAMTARVMSQLHPGAMVLMHDGGGNRATTLAQLPQLIVQIKAAGYTIVVPPVA